MLSWEKLFELGPAAFFYLAAAALQMSGITNTAGSVVIAGIGSAWLAAHFVHKVHSKRLAQGGRGVEPSHLISVGLIGGAIFISIAAAGYAWQTFWPPKKIDVSQVSLPNIETIPQKSEPYYAPSDKARIAEALYELSEVLNKTGAQMSERAQAAVSLADARRPADAEIVLAQSEKLSLEFNRSLDPNNSGLLAKYQAYSAYIEEIIDGKKYENLSRDLLVSIRNLLNAVPLISKHDGREAETLKAAFGVLTGPIGEAEMKFRNWRVETLDRIDERRRFSTERPF